MSLQCEVAIIGAGIAGLGTALELAHRGAQVVVFESGACGAGTSAGSLKIMHGGMRYLQHLDLYRLFHSVRAQAALLRDFPDLVKPLHCLLPLERYGIRSRIPMSIAARLYSLCSALALRQLAGIAALPPPVVVSDHQFPPELEAFSRPQGLFSWWDAQLLSHEALVERIAGELTACGVTVLQGTSVTEVAPQQRTFVLTTGRREQWVADFVVDLSGRSVGSLHPSKPFAQVQWSRAFNVVLDVPLPEGQAIAFNGRSGKSFFLVGRGSECALGTGYLPCTGRLPVIVEQHEAGQFVVEASEARPELSLLRRKIKRLECGSIPVKKWGANGPQFYGLDQIFVQGSYIAALVNKYTTFRSLAHRIAALYSSRV